MMGPTGVTVAGNLRRLRHERGWSLKYLSGRLSALGWPLSLKVIHNIEALRREVAVDDLVKLAEALGVPPEGLLSPASWRTETVAAGSFS